MASCHGAQEVGTLSETTLEQGAAAWRWFQHHASGMCPPDVNLEDAHFSKFAVPHEIFRDTLEENESKHYFICLGHSTWACLMWPLARFIVGEETFFFMMPAESAYWKHICRPLDWNVIPPQPASYNELICLKQIGEDPSALSLAFISCMKRFLAAKLFSFQRKTRQKHIS